MLEALGEPAAAAEPAVRALHDPALGQQHEALRRVRALDDLEWDAGVSLHRVGRRLALIAAVGDRLLERGKPPARDRHQRRDHVAILHVAGRDREIDQEAERIDGRVTLFSLNFLACVISGRITPRPPFSALFTLWLSTMASVGSAG